MKKRISSLIVLFLIFVTIVILALTIVANLIVNDKISSEITSVKNTLFFIGLVLFFIMGLMLGNHEQKNGLLVGIIFVLIVYTIGFLISFLGFDQGLSLSGLVKVAAFSIASGIGSALGVNIPKFL